MFATRYLNPSYSRTRSLHSKQPETNMPVLTSTVCADNDSQAKQKQSNASSMTKVDDSNIFIFAFVDWLFL